MGDVQTSVVLEALDRLERLEAPLLTWGLTSGGFSAQEIRAELSSLCDERGCDLDAVLDELLNRGLVVSLRYSGAEILRTRMAETVRLLALQRQLFERHLDGNAWMVAPRLVADYRLKLQPRRYPRRDVAAAQIESALVEAGVADSLRRFVLDHLRGGAGPTAPERLSGFQVRATVEILRKLRSSKTTGVIVTAGTGSGKTLAYYLPALAEVARRVEATPWVKSVAIYPRNELLKDQFSETYAEARRLDEPLAMLGRRRITIGAFFGQAPRVASEVTEKSKWGPRIGAGWRCPYLRCPACDQDVVWRDSDARAGLEQLVCSDRSCGYVVRPDEIVLTRHRMTSEPPDVLFTTTEMLNQRFADSRYRHLFGLGSRAVQRPSTVLLDEVHTYAGTHGAQVGLLLRRWQHALGRPVVFVGLSATLRDAGGFFADLTGVAPMRITTIAPSEFELTSEGMEYLIALRGDPGSGASLLSTTIQTAMLLRRVLDPTTKPSGDVYGQRLFLFTDDLDITNRLYYDLLDAEGYDAFGRPDPQRQLGSLANLRSSVLSDRERRLRDGQSWDMAEALGHDLTQGNRIRVGRTSSQDTGVDSASDVIVATAALEVGFNDHTVGAVMQHKSPRAAAQFVQRRGRAGRVRNMRPWTVVVLSDYGRDRITYQSYERLFDPELEPQRLPVRNRYILRMQAVYSLMDYLGARVQEPKGSVWLDFSGPVQDDGQWTAQAEQRRATLLTEVEGLLDDRQAQADLADHLSGALGIRPDEVAPLLWDPPRALLTEVLPTIRRRLRTNWRNPYPLPTGSEEYHVGNSPLQEFVPRALFADLSLPEVTIRIPAATVRDEQSEASLPIAQAIREFMPGRVTRRYSTVHRYQRHWIPVDLGLGRQAIDLDAISAHRELLGRIEVDGTHYEVYRPWELTPQKPPSSVLDSSNALPTWRTSIDVAAVTAHRLEPPAPSRWSEVVTALEFFTHGRRAPAHVLRAAVESTGSVNLREGASLVFQAGFEDRGRPAALGFALHVDALRVVVRLPQDLHALDFPAEEVRALRKARFRDLVEADEQLTATAGRFRTPWLARIYLSALVSKAVRAGGSLASTRQAIGSRLPGLMKEVTEQLFGAFMLDEPDPEAPGKTPSRLLTALLDLIDDPKAMAAVDEHATALWTDPDLTWEPWLRRRYTATLGAAVLHAAQQLAPNVVAGDLVLDIDALGQSDPDDVELWITETTLGGAGAIEELANAYVSDPRRFFRLVEAALAPSDFELVDREVGRVLELLREDEGVRESFRRLRAALHPADASQALGALMEALSERNVFVCHPVVAAISARVLRPGSSPDTDTLVLRLITEWKRLEEALGVEVDSRVIAFSLGGDEDLDAYLSHLPVPTGTDRQAWRTGAVFSLLWPRGEEVVSQGLVTYNPFTDLPATDRRLVLKSLEGGVPRVDISSELAEERIAGFLRDRGVVDVEDSIGLRGGLAGFLTGVVARPVEIGFLQVYPRLVGIYRLPTVVARLELAEAFQ